MGTYKGINSGIDRDTVVVTMVAGGMSVTVTSDLDSTYDDALQRLGSMDYSAVGGNPITQYYSGLKSIHLEGFDNGTGHGFNFTTVGALDTRYSLAAVYNDGDPTGNLTGVDTIYIDTNSAGKANVQVLETVIHEMLHESEFIDGKTDKVLEYLKEKFPEKPVWGSPKELTVLRFAVEHVTMKVRLEEFVQVNRLSGGFFG